MTWHKNITAKLADVLRFVASGALMISAIALSITTTYIVVKLCWHFAKFLNRTLFENPW